MSIGTGKRDRFRRGKEATKKGKHDCVFSGKGDDFTGRSSKGKEERLLLLAICKRSGEGR